MLLDDLKHDNRFNYILLNHKLPVGICLRRVSFCMNLAEDSWWQDE